MCSCLHAQISTSWMFQVNMPGCSIHRPLFSVLRCDRPVLRPQSFEPLPMTSPLPPELCLRVSLPTGSRALGSQHAHKCKKCFRDKAVSPSEREEAKRHEDQFLHISENSA